MFGRFGPLLANLAYTLIASAAAGFLDGVLLVAVLVFECEMGL